ncbi:MAG: hypothetical protein PWR10_1570 [Halanaerobiales bacterium]|nr:hypothetical protein [Halanaerobiales bacterium]
MKKLLCIIHLKGNRRRLEINGELAALSPEKRQEKIDRGRVIKKCS